MRLFVLIFAILFSMPLVSLNTAQAAVHHEGVLIEVIQVQGFELADKEQFVKLFKPYRNKYLTGADMDGLLKKVQFIYTNEGYQELVKITYKVDHRRLIFSVLMAS